MYDVKPILLVDDSKEDVELTRMGLLTDNRIANPIDVVYDGEEALDYLYRRGKFKARRGANPAVILLDLKMPKVSGFEVLERLKKDDELRYIPVVIFSSSKEERDIVKSYSSGSNAFVVKPVDAGSFMDAIKQIGLFWAVVNVPPAD